MGTEEFSIVNNRIGWGEPENGLWFIGVEEAGVWKCDGENQLDESRREIRRMSNESFTKYLNKDARDGVNWPIAVVTAKISSLVSGSKLPWRRYREEVLWLNRSGTFNGNIFPLGKPNLKSSAWPAGYKELFGFSAAEYKLYLFEVKCSRYCRFRELRDEKKPQAIICFGMSHWNEFENIFVKSPEIKSVYLDRKTKVYERDRVILTRHFSNGMPDSTVEFIAEQLKSWNVSLA